MQTIIAAFSVPSIVDVNPAGNPYLSGTTGHYIENLYPKILRNFTVISVDDGEPIGQDKGNNTYSGLLGLLQRDAHLSFVPFGMTVPQEIIDYSSAISSIDGVFGQQAKLVTRHSHVFKSFAVYSGTVQMMFFVTVIFLAFAFKIISKRHSKGKGSRFEFFCKVLRILVYQADSEYIAKLSCSVTMATLVSFYAVNKMFEGSIKTEVVTKDVSQIVDNLDDLLRLKHLRPGFIKNDAFTNFFRFHSTPKYREVWNRAVRMGIEMSLYTLSPESVPQDLTNLVFAGNRYIAFGVLDVNCKRRPTCKSWIGSSRYTEIVNAFYLSKSVSKTFKTEIDFRATLIAQMGVVNFIWKTGAIHGPSAIGASPICTKSRLDDLFEDIHMPEVVPLSYYFRLFEAFVFSVVFCCIVLKVKKAIRKLLVMRRVAVDHFNPTTE